MDGRDLSSRIGRTGMGGIRDRLLAFSRQPGITVCLCSMRVGRDMSMKDAVTQVRSRLRDIEEWGQDTGAQRSALRTLRANGTACRVPVPARDSSASLRVSARILSSNSASFFSQRSFSRRSPSTSSRSVRFSASSARVQLIRLTVTHPNHHFQSHRETFRPDANHAPVEDSSCYPPCGG